MVKIIEFLLTVAAAFFLTFAILFALIMLFPSFGEMIISIVEEAM